MQSPVKSRRRTQQPQHNSDSDLDDLAPEAQSNVVTTIFHDDEPSQDTEYEPAQDEIEWASDDDDASVGDGSSQGSIDSIDFEYINLVLEAGKEITDEEKAIVDTRIVIDSNVRDSKSSKQKLSLPRLVEGWGQHRYVYEPSLLPVPPQAKIEHAHAIVVDDNGAIIITYKDQDDSSRCLLRWGNVTEVAEFLGPSNEALCSGVPHGLITAVEDGLVVPKSADDASNVNIRALSTRESSSMGVLYHANNEQRLHKTDTNGNILWTVTGKLQPPDGRRHSTSSTQDHPARDDTVHTPDTIHNDNKIQNEQEEEEPYSPTWFASQPDSPYLYLADGYGSSRIYVLNKYHGNYTGHSFGGTGNQHGSFQTCHSISHDPRKGDHEMVVCDRENHRLEYFRVDPTDPSVFDYVRTVSFHPLLQRPCNLRVRASDGRAIVPFLEGSVGILDRDNALVDVLNVTATLGEEGFLHPHDAHFVPGTSGDIVVVTWNPGRIGYFRQLPSKKEEDYPQREQASVQTIEED